MAATLGKIYEIALRNYHMKLLAGEKGLYRLIDWVHMVEENDYIEFLKGRELIVTTGIANPDEEKLLQFAEKVYEASASGLVINIGKYVPKVPASVLKFGEEHDFPIFALPWEVHLVDFNRELCNMIYRTEQEYDSLDSAFQKAVFSPKEVEQFLPLLQKEGIHGDTKLSLIQCYFSFTEESKGKTYDVTQFYYRYHRFCQQILSSYGVKYVVFHYELYVTMILIGVGKEQIDQIIEEIKKSQTQKEYEGILHIAVSGADTTILNLSEKYKKMTLLCRKCAREHVLMCREDEAGVWKLLLDVADSKKLRRYEQQVLGELERLDAETGSEYCRILETYLKENGSVQEVAAQCFLHRNTVAYHLKKIAEITGHNLNDADHRMELYLAFQIRKILEL